MSMHRIHRRALPGDRPAENPRLQQSLPWGSSRRIPGSVFGQALVGIFDQFSLVPAPPELPRFLAVKGAGKRDIFSVSMAQASGMGGKGFVAFEYLFGGAVVFQADAGKRGRNGSRLRTERTCRDRCPQMVFPSSSSTLTACFGQIREQMSQPMHRVLSQLKHDLRTVQSKGRFFRPRQRTLLFFQATWRAHHTFGVKS